MQVRVYVLTIDDGLSPLCLHQSCLRICRWVLQFEWTSRPIVEVITGARIHWMVDGGCCYSLESILLKLVREHLLTLKTSLQWPPYGYGFTSFTQLHHGGRLHSNKSFCWTDLDYLKFCNALSSPILCLLAHMFQNFLQTLATHRNADVRTGVCPFLGRWSVCYTRSMWIFRTLQRELWVSSATLIPELSLAIYEVRLSQYAHGPYEICNLL